MKEKMRGTVIFFSCCILSLSESFTPKFVPLNTKQFKLQDCIQDRNKTIVLAIGSAGTGKTLLSCQGSLNLLHHKKVKKIILTRPTISVEDENIGFLPGSLEDKMTPWLRPFFDNLLEFNTPHDVQKMIQENKLEVCPLGFMRGRTFRDSIIILDEAQNTTPKQMKMILTRIGQNTKLVINGDLHQSDLNGLNGLQDFLYRLDSYYKGRQYMMYEDGIATIFFENHQIIRHPLIEKIVEIYD